MANYAYSGVLSRSLFGPFAPKRGAKDVH